MSAMTTFHPHAMQRALLFAALVATGLALAFAAGRASSGPTYVRAPAAVPAAPAAETEAPRQPWAERGFRDDETWQTVGKSPDTN